MRADGVVSGSPAVAVALALALALSASVGGVLAFGSPSAPTPDPVGVDASDAYESVDGLTATRTTVVEHGGDVRRTVARVRLRPGTQYRRVAVVDATDRRYERVVANGSALSLYDREENAVTRFSLSGPVDERTFGDRVEALFERLNVTAPDGSASTTVTTGISPLPVLPAGDNGPQPTSSEVGHLRLAFDGTETVDGREAYVLRVESAAGGGFEQTVWVDTDHFVPLKQRTAWTDGGEDVTMTTTYANVTFGSIPNAAFAFDAPANATVETLDTPDQTTYATADRLRATVETSVPDPDVPSSFRLAYASRTTGDISGVGLKYVNETGSVSVAKYGRTFPARGDRTVSVADHVAAVSFGPTTSVSWNCGEYRYTVRGRGVSVDVLVAVAKSAACE